MTHAKPPQADGLYDPRYEHDACGVAMVARLDNEPSHEVVVAALEALDNLEHRGAEGADVRTGDGAGILIQLPDAFFRARRRLRAARGRALRRRRVLPAARRDAPRADRGSCSSSTSASRARASSAGATSRSTRRTSATRANARRPHIRQLFDRGRARLRQHDQDAFERKLYVIRRIVELAGGPGLLLAELLARARCVYKGMLISHQLRGFYPDLQRRALRERAWRSCTRASRRTRSRAGSSPIPTA